MRDYSRTIRSIPRQSMNASRRGKLSSNLYVTFFLFNIILNVPSCAKLSTPVYTVSVLVPGYLLTCFFFYENVYN